MPFTIWCNADLSPAALELLRAEVAPHRLVMAEQRILFAKRPQPDPAFLEADVAFGQPDAAQVIASSRLRWFQITSAGYTPFDREDLRAALRARGAAFTKSSVVYDEPCAEHVLAFVLADARALPAAFRNGQEARGWPQRAVRAGSRLLAGQSAVLFGFGSIARRLAPMMAPLGVRLTGVRRSVAGDEPVATLALDDPGVAGALAEADHVIDILPASAETRGYFDARRFAAMKQGAVFYNIGRGTTVDQDALLAALAGGRLRGAYLDVTDPEPLPAEHPLWREPRCVITPHTAGGHVDEDERLVRHFAANLRRFAASEPLVDRVV